VYLTTNLINGKQYVGDHSVNTLEKDKYLGSGCYIKKAEKLYGKQNFKREILEFFSTKHEAFNAQEKYINEYNTLSPNGYNISPKGGHNVKDCISEETKQKMSIKGKGRKHTEKAKKNMSNAHRGEGNGMFGKTHSENTKEKYFLGENNGMYNKSLFDCWVEKYGIEIAEKKKEEWKLNIGKGNKGHTHTKEAKEKISNANKGKIPSNKGKKMSEEQKEKLRKPKNKK
jgi:group I intron endonuclease